MNYSDQLSDQQRKQYRSSAIKSTLFGCVSEQLIGSNTLLIVYLVMLGGSDSLSMFSTSIGSIAALLLVIPLAALTNRIGIRFAYRMACLGSLASLFLMAAAPYFGRAACSTILICCLAYSAAQCLYSSTWYPLCDAFLRPNERGSFFGTMRFTYMTLNAGLLFLFGCLMGEKPPVWIIQLILAFSGLTMLGRMYYLNQLPVSPDSEKKRFTGWTALQISMRNSMLTGFSTYSCLISISTATIPAALVFMKTQMNLGAFTLMTITSIGMLGSITGYFMVGPTMKKIGIRKFQLLTHVSIILIILMFLLVRQGNRFMPYFLGGIFFYKGFFLAFLSCFNSTQMLSLARPGNKIMAMAYVSFFNSLGALTGRLMVTMTLALGVLTPVWKLGSLKMSNFHFIFFFFLMISIFSLLLLPQTPAVVPRHKDYYNP